MATLFSLQQHTLDISDQANLVPVDLVTVSAKTNVTETVKQKIEAGYSVQTAVHIRNAISAVFNHARLKRAYSGDNPAQGVRMPEMLRRDAHSLSFQTGRDLLAVLPPTVRAMALLSMTTSMNVAEMLALRWKRVNLTGEVAIVGAEITRIAHRQRVDPARPDLYRHPRRSSWVLACTLIR